MEYFPQESLERAKKVIDKLKRRNTSKNSILIDIYNKKFFEIEYGFDEQLKTGNCGPFFHEIDALCDCFTLSGVMYLLAKEAGTNPQLYRAMGLRDYYEGEDLSKEFYGDHSFVVANPSKDKQIVLDPFYSLCHKLRKWDKENNTMYIWKAQDQKMKIRTYQNIEQLTEKEFVRRTNTARTPEGGRKVLYATQKVKAAGRWDNYLHFDEDTKILSFSLRATKGKLFENELDENHVTDFKVPVSNDGNFDIEDGSFEIYHCKSTGWATHIDVLAKMIASKQEVNPIWDFWEKLIHKGWRQSIPFGTGTLNVFSKFAKMGLYLDLSTEPETLAKNLALEIPDTYNSAINNLEEISKRFIDASKKDEVSWKILLAKCKYALLSSSVRSKNNPLGLIYSDEEKEKPLWESIENIHGGFLKLAQIKREEVLVKADLTPGSVFNATRKMSKQVNQLFSSTDVDFNRVNARNKLDRELYSWSMDHELFRHRSNIPESSVVDLEKGLTDEDILLGAKTFVGSKLIFPFISQDSLFARSYHRGLKKILNKHRTNF